MGVGGLAGRSSLEFSLSFISNFQSLFFIIADINTSMLYLPIIKRSHQIGHIKLKFGVGGRMMKFSSSATESWRELSKVLTHFLTCP